MTTHLYRLLEIHQRIDQQLRQESGYRWPDLFKVMRLKKMKLAIKDRIAALTPKPRSAR